jgi:hypothetical protein
MPSTFDNFTLGTTAGGATPIQADDYVVGFDTAVLNGERKWPITTLAQSVSSVMSQEITNKISQQAITVSSPAAAKAWVNWTSDGTSTGAINVTSSYNVTSVSRVGTSGDGRYTFDINIQAGILSNTNYTWFASGRENDDTNEIILLGAYKSDTKTTTKLRLISKEGATATSLTEGNVVIFA